MGREMSRDCRGAYMSDAILTDYAQFLSGLHLSPCCICASVLLCSLTRLHQCSLTRLHQCWMTPGPLPCTFHRFLLCVSSLCSLVLSSSAPIALAASPSRSRTCARPRSCSGLAAYYCPRRPPSRMCERARALSGNEETGRSLRDAFFFATRSRQEDGHRFIHEHVRIELF